MLFLQTKFIQMMERTSTSPSAAGSIDNSTPVSAASEAPYQVMSHSRFPSVSGSPKALSQVTASSLLVSADNYKQKYIPLFIASSKQIQLKWAKLYSYGDTCFLSSPITGINSFLYNCNPFHHLLFG